MKVLSSIMTVVILIGSLLFGGGTKSFFQDHYVYPITVQSEDWFDYSVLEKNEMLRISQSVLEQMNEKQLIEAIADFPYLVDIYVFDTIEDGLEHFKNTCSAYAELITRNNYQSSLNLYANELIDYYKENPRCDGRTEFVCEALRDLIQTVNSENCDMNRSSETPVRSAPITPSGYTVYYTTPTESHTGSYHATKDTEVVTTYGVTQKKPGSCLYNCHSYAWHSQAATNIYWIPDPISYLNDPVYSCVYIGYVSTCTSTTGVSYHDRIVYAGRCHSALFIGDASSGAPLAGVKVISKWGTLGVFEHYIVNVPADYSYSSITIWH